MIEICVKFVSYGRDTGAHGDGKPFKLVVCCKRNSGEDSGHEILMLRPVRSMVRFGTKNRKPVKT